MRINPYLTYNGQCKEAFKFYEQVLGGKITIMMTWGESAMAAEAGPDLQGKILHATFSFDDQMLQGGDTMPARYQRPQGVSIALHLADVDRAHTIFDALAAGGLVQMPMQQTFWARRFGMVTDRFGIPWIINCTTT